ncbi:sarcosine oxidase subunit gamma family protein [Emcibacter sp. SYSU 3D8]|uniref:sarcosine oxidase subunit gamma n=1 Tax=Emcibacter sp. SYSU 3D8 TaxID=3133969 RepID=UPI0031FE54D4
MPDIVAGSPLRDEAKDNVAARIQRNGLLVRENPSRHKLLVVTNGSPEVARGIATALGVPLPEAADAVTGDDPCCYRIAPNRWLVCYEKGYGLGERLIRTSAGMAAAVNDVSDGYVSIQLSGKLAYDLLVRGCEQDLHRRAFGQGRFAATQIAAIDVLIHAAGEQGTYELIVDRSLAMDLWMWLKDRAAELSA